MPLADASRTSQPTSARRTLAWVSVRSVRSKTPAYKRPPGLQRPWLTIRFDGGARLQARRRAAAAAKEQERIKQANKRKRYQAVGNPVAARRAVSSRVFYHARTAQVRSICYFKGPFGFLEIS
jgi:hypothetical protein